MKKLKPCPFCKDDGNPKIMVMERQDDSKGKRKHIVGRYVQCQTCGVKTKTFKHHDYNQALDSIGYLEDMATEAWNQRAERTCKNIGEPKGSFLCSECGWGDFAPIGLPLRNANYCPNCGVKVVE